MSQRVVHPLWRCCHWPLLGKGRLGCPWQGSSCDWPTCICQPSPKTCRCECLEGPPAQSTLLSSAGKITIGAPAVLSTIVFRLAWAIKDIAKTPEVCCQGFSVLCNGTVRLPKTRLSRSHFNTIIIHMYRFFHIYCLWAPVGHVTSSAAHALCCCIASC